MDYIGDERRRDSISVRLALLERSYVENKESLVSVHKRITEVKTDLIVEVRNGFKQVASTASEVKLELAEQKKVTDKIINDHSWFYKWLIAEWTAIAGLGVWFFTHATKGK